MRKGDLINISTRYGVKQVEILSIGNKYITTTGKYKFYADTLREVSGFGISAYIIPDIEEYYNKLERNLNEDKVNTFFRKDNTSKLSGDDLENILNIIDKYK